LNPAIPRVSPIGWEFGVKTSGKIAPFETLGMTKFSDRVSTEGERSIREIRKMAELKDKDL
jgi:hypothetical protein